MTDQLETAIQRLYDSMATAKADNDKQRVAGLRQELETFQDAKRERDNQTDWEIMSNGGMALQAKLQGSKGPVTRSDNNEMTATIGCRNGGIELVVTLNGFGNPQYALSRVPFGGRGERYVLAAGNLLED